MITVLGREVSIVKCNIGSLVGIRGIVSLESMHMLTISSATRTVAFPKLGSVLQLSETGKIVLGDEMRGRLEDRVARGSKV